MVSPDSRRTVLRSQAVEFARFCFPAVERIFFDGRWLRLFANEPAQYGDPVMMFFRKLHSRWRVTAWYCLGHMQKRFEQIEDLEKRARVLKFMYSGEVSKFCRQAPVIIAVIGSLKVGSVDVPCDLSAVTENILLEAQSLGLAACWVHGPVATSRDAIKFKRILNIPEAVSEYKVIAYVAVGFPAEQRKHPRPKLELEEMVYWETYGNKERA